MRQPVVYLNVRKLKLFSEHVLAVDDNEEVPLVIDFFNFFRDFGRLWFFLLEILLLELASLLFFACKLGSLLLEEFIDFRLHLLALQLLLEPLGNGRSSFSHRNFVSVLLQPLEVEVALKNSVSAQVHKLVTLLVVGVKGVLVH